jgi:hypothetical protein
MSLTRMFVTLIFLSPSLTPSSWAESPVSPVRFVYPAQPSSHLEQALQDVVKAEQKRRGTQLTLEQRPDPFEVLKALIASHFAGDLPDIALVHTADVATLVSLGILPPLSGKLSTKTDVRAAPACSHTRCTAPLYRTAPVWFFNQEILFRLNRDTTRVPPSGPELLAFAASLQNGTAALKGRASLVFGSAGNNTLLRWAPLGHTLEEPLPQTSVQWAQRMAPWTKKGIVGGLSDSDAVQQFLEQKSVIYLGTLEQLEFLKSSASFKLGHTASAEAAQSGLDVVLLRQPARPAAVELFESLTSAQTHRKLREKGPVLEQKSYSKSQKRLPIERIPPQARDDWTRRTWRAAEAGEEALRQLPQALQKLLSSGSP